MTELPKMTEDFNEYLDSLPADRRAKIEARSKEIIAEYMTLQELRKAREFSQETLADVLGWRQGEISRLEHQTDFYLSTIRRYVEALGGKLELTAVFPDSATIKIEQFSDLGKSRKTIKKRKPLQKNKARKAG